MPEVSGSEHLKILLWKSWKIIEKRPGVFVQKVIFPALLILVFNPSNIGETIEEQSDEVQHFPKIHQNLTWTDFAEASVWPRSDHVSYGVNWIPSQWKDDVAAKIWYSPQDGDLGNEVQALLTDMASMAAPTPIPSTMLRGFKTVDELRETIASSTGEAWIGIHFDSGAPMWQYRLIINGTYSPTTDTRNQVVDSGSPLESEFGKYIDTGILYMQTLIDQAIIRRAGLGEEHTPIFSIQRASQKTFNSQEVPWILQWLNGWLVGLALMFAYGSLASSISYDQEFGITRSFFLVGVSPTIYWLHWMLTMTVQFVPMSVAMAGFVFLTKLAHFSSFVLVWLNILLSLLHMIPLAVATVGLMNVKTAGSVGFLGTFVGAGIYVAVLSSSGDVSAVRRVMSAILPWWGLFDGEALVAVYDWNGRFEGITFDNAWESGFGAVLLFQVVGILAWSLAGMIIHNSNLFGGRDPTDVGLKDENQDSVEAYERTDSQVRVTELRKRWGKKTDPNSVLSVDRLDFEMCKDEVFGLLGHNGAGKSTTISLMAGEFPSSAGTVLYKSDDGEELKVGEDDDEIRQRIGVCLQTDPLIEIFSAREHLWMFAKLKGLEQDVDAEVDARLKQCGLQDDADRWVEDYSGGMKRKVSLAIALLGDPEVIYLDEPTAGMDPVSRRQVWDMIIEAKKGRVVVLTTHFMDEADLLSDRIAIMKKGRIITCGTSLFLKHKFGAGYTLSCSGEEGVVQAIVQKICPNGSLTGSHSGELRFALPFSDCGKLPDLLSELSTVSQDVSIGMTTLEEVFLKTGEDELEDACESNIDVEHSDINLSDVWPSRPFERSPSFFKKVLATVRLIAISNLRDAIVIFFGMVMPTIFIIVGWTAGSISPDSFVTPDPLHIGWDLVGREPLKVIGPTFPATDTVSFGTMEQYSADLNVGRVATSWIGGFENQTSGLHMIFNSSFAPSVSLLANAHANKTLSAATPKQGISMVLDPTDFKPFHIVDVGALLIPMLTGMGVSSLAHVVIEAVIWRQQKTSLIFKMLGVSMPVQMLSFSLFKIIFGFIPALIANLVMAAATGNAVLGSGGRWLAFILLQLTYAGSIIPFALTLTPLFPSIRIATEVFPTVLNFSSIVPYLVVWILTSSENESTQDTGRVLGDVFSFIPTVAYQRGLQQIILLESSKGDDDVSWGDTFGWDQRISFVLMANIIVTIVCSSIVHWQYLEYDLGKDKESGGTSSGSSVAIDADVQELNNLAKTSGEGISALNLSKTFGKKTVVDGVSIACNPGEIFVLLGPNGAGKTTTMRMLTGDLNSSSGAVRLADQQTTTSEGFSLLYGSGVCGFCPQFDGLVASCTVHEHLKGAAAVKGMSIADAERQINGILSALDIHSYKDREARKLSGGNKRKLSLAIAIIGAPKVLFLDEPSTGMDPRARRKMWSLLKPDLEVPKDAANVENGMASSPTPAMLLSTHYMDEASTLASRVGIVVQGKMKATGTVGHLINRYCAKLSIEATAVHGQGSSTAVEMEEKLMQKLPNGAVVLERVGNKVKVELPMTANSNLVQDLATAIRLLEENKGSCLVEHYSVSPMTLEQIFIDMAKGQSEEDTAKAPTRSASFTGRPAL